MDQAAAFRTVLLKLVVEAGLSHGAWNYFVAIIPNDESSCVCHVYLNPDRDKGHLYDTGSIRIYPSRLALTTNFAENGNAEFAGACEITEVALSDPELIQKVRVWLEPMR